jgi:hypothetical protein
VQVKGSTGGPRPAADASYQPVITSSSESSSEDEGGSPGAEAAGVEASKAAADLQKEEAERQALKDRILQQYGADSEDEEGQEGSQVGSVT